MASALESHEEGTRADEMVREHAAWAVEKLRGEAPKA
jgi:hypothetical protein